MVRSRLSAPATTLPDELVNATCWNHPSRTSMLIGVVGSTSVALSAGRNVTLASGGGLAFSDCLVDPPKQAANTLGAKTPTARVARARRRVTGEKPRAVSTTNQHTGENDPPRAPAPYNEQPTSTGSGINVTPNTSRTPSRTVRANATTSVALAPPRLVKASACLVDSRQRAVATSG